MRSSSATRPLHGTGGQNIKSTVTWSLDGAQHQDEDEQRSAAASHTTADVLQPSVASSYDSQACAGRDSPSASPFGHTSISSHLHLIPQGAPAQALVTELSWPSGALASKPSAHAAAGHDPAAVSTAALPPVPADHPFTGQKVPSQASKASAAGAGTAAAITAAIPPLQLPPVLPLSAAQAVAPPAQPARISYQLSDSHGALHFVSSADVDAYGKLAGPNPAAATSCSAAGLARLQAAAEQQPWTQNTARALRRTQQEVAELCAAGGLPLPAERAYCFDLVGIREAGFGTSSNSRPIVSSSGSRHDSSNGSSSRRPSGNGASSSSGAVTSPSHTDAASWSNCTTPAAVSASAAAAAAGPQQHAQQTQGEAAQATSTPSKTSGSHDAATEQPHRTSKCLSQHHQQQQQQHGQRRMSATGLSKRAQSSQRHARPCRKSSNTQTGTLGCGAVMQPADRDRRSSTTSSVPAGATAHSSVLDRVERRLAVHAELQQQPFLGCSSKAGAAVRAGFVPVTAAAADVVGITSVPQCWWEAQERPLSDPLLLCLPVWVREALELELMEL